MSHRGSTRSPDPKESPDQQFPPIRSNANPKRVLAYASAVCPFGINIVSRPPLFLFFFLFFSILVHGFYTYQ